MRQRLPPLFTMQAFEAAARLGNFSRAAAELHLTPGAVSRQVRQLEDWSGQTLFERAGAVMRLTDEGKSLLARLSGPLAALHDAVYGTAPSEHPSLQISTLNSLARAWLLPRLGDFISREPEVRLVIHTEFALVRPPPRVAMIALRHAMEGEGRGELLFADRVVAVASAELAHEVGRDPRRWPARRLLAHLTGEAAQWLQEAGAATALDGLASNDAGLIADAAVTGLGIAITRLSLVLPHLHSGQLVLAHPQVLHAGRGNLCLVREDSAQLPVVRRFLAWLRPQAERTAKEIAKFDDLRHPLRLAAK